MSVPERILAKYHLTPPASFLKAQANTVALTFKSLLTYPMRDIAGEYIRPDGCNFQPHHRDPSIDLEHRQHPIAKGQPVAWARESLEEPGAPYSVEMVRLNFADAGKPDDWHVVPVGTEYYKSSCRLSMQVFAMRDSGELPASSLEFSPVPGHFKATGAWNHLDDRAAMDFDVVDVHRWTVCAKGVNPGAMLLEKSLPQVHAGLSKILRDNRVYVGGTPEPLHPYIRKALAPAAEAPKRTTVTVPRLKAMDTDTTTQPDAAADADLDTQSQTAVEQMVPEDGPTPTAQCGYELAQALADIRAHATAQLKRGEHKTGLKKLTGILEKIDVLSEAAMQAAKTVEADRTDEKGGDEEPEEDGEGGGDEEPEVSQEDMETDDDGLLKGLPPVVKKSVKRFTVREVSEARAAAAVPSEEVAVPQASPEEIVALKSEIHALKKQMRFLA